MKIQKTNERWLTGWHLLSWKTKMTSQGRFWKTAIGIIWLTLAVLKIRKNPDGGQKKHRKLLKIRKRLELKAAKTGLWSWTQFFSDLPHRDNRNHYNSQCKEQEKRKNKKYKVIQPRLEKPNKEALIWAGENEGRVETGDWRSMEKRQKEDNTFAKDS